MKELRENTTTPNDPNVATTDENLSVNNMFQQATMPSLGKQIFSVLPVHGPTAALFNITNNVKVITPEVPPVRQVETCTPTSAISTTFTLNINGVDFSYTSSATATLAEITAGLANEINVLRTNGSVPVTAIDNGLSITLQANFAGNAFTVLSTGVGIVTLVQTTPNSPRVRAVTVNDFALVRNDVNVVESNSIPTSITQETVQDLSSQYGKEAEKIIGKLLRGLANDEENAVTLNFLDGVSDDYGVLTLTGSNNAELNLFEITQRVHEIILKINNTTMRSFDAFAVVPYIALAGVAGLSNYAGGESEEHGLFVAKIGKTKFYLNPDVNSSTVYVGIKDRTNPSKSSAVFSPYTSTIVESVDPNDGSLTYNIFNRFAITESPLHVVGNEMLYKFNLV